MEDIIRALLDVVRAQHSATEGTDEAPFDMNDIVDMAMNIVGRPDEADEAAEMVDSIQRLVETLAPDIFPPKTFEEMDDAERAASAASMIEERLLRGLSGGRNQAASPQQSETDRTGGQESASRQSSPDETEAASQEEPALQEAHQAAYEETSSAADPLSGFEDTFDAQQTAELNDLIYKNLMEMMGLQGQQVEYPFDQSQIRYGREKSITEMLEEEKAEEDRLRQEQMEMDRRNAQAGYRPSAVRGEEEGPEGQEEEQRPRSAWELAQDAINQQTGAGADRHGRSAWELAQDAVNEDEKAHEKEPYIPKVEEAPAGKSASQLAAEAIRRSQEEDREKLEIEKQAERLMEEAKKRGQDPMKFALHQQEILRYMEKNSDELVSFEDYEDLSPEEKYEIEKQLHIEKQLADGVHPDEVDEQVPEEFIPEEMKAALAAQAAAEGAGASADGTAVENVQQAAEIADGAAGQETQTGVPPVLTEEMLRQLSQEVLRENSDMILAENEDEDMDSLNDMIMANIRNMMSGSGVPVPQEDVDDLLDQAAAFAKGEAGSGASGRTGQSAVELAKAAQQAARPEPQEIKEGKSAVELAKEAQKKAEEARKAAQAAEGIAAGQDEDASGQAENVSASAGEEDVASDKEEASPGAEASASEGNADEAFDRESAADEETGSDEVTGSDQEETDLGEEDAAPEHTAGEEHISGQEETAQKEEPSETEHIFKEEKPQAEPEEEYEYVDPDELVLGEHTQAEIDEALENLNSLGLEGEVYERAKRMLLLELAGSEGELDAWLREQEQGKKKKASVSALDHDDSMELDMDDFDEDALEKELELAMDEDFLEIEDEDSDEEEESEEAEESGEEEESEEATGESDEEEMPEEEADESDEEEVPEKAADAPKAEVEEETHEESDATAAEEDSLSAEEETTATEDTAEDAAASGENDVISEVEVEDTVPVPGAGERRGASPKASGAASRKRVVKKREKKNAGRTPESHTDWSQPERPAAEREYQVSLRHPFVLKNSASFMDQFEDYIHDTQENRKLSTGFKRLDAMLRYGLHKGTYFIDSEPQYLKNGFMQQMADRAAESGVDVLYISTELSRYDLMVDTISRLSYEINQGDPDKAVSAMDIMTGENGADLGSLKDELNWYRGRISEHLYILDQEAVAQYADEMSEVSAGDILAELIRSIVREGAHKPVVFIDNIENILSIEDTEDMKPLMEGIRRLAGELGIPILMSYGYAQAESETELSAAEREFHETLGNMCDVYMELRYADMITEDSVELTEEDIEEMMEDGETLLINVLLHRNRRPLKASCQIQAAPKFNFYEE